MWIYILVALLSLYLLIYFAYLLFGRKIKTRNFVIQTDKIRKEEDKASKIRLLLLTDLHSCKYGKNQEVLKRMIDDQHPDIILLGGDIVDDDAPQAGAFELLSFIGIKYKTFYVSGNHEHMSKKIKQIKNDVRNCNITVLEGDTEKLDINGNKINICGIDDPDVGKRKHKEQVEKCGQNIDKDVFTVLISHRPELIDIYNKYPFDLVVAGHAHGGQFAFPFILPNGLYAPNQGVFPKYTNGMYSLKNGKLVVSRGLGKNRPYLIPRIFNNPEIITIDLE